MKRKFSFNIPPLKIGPSKADNKALKHALAVTVDGLDSPVDTPKSVRPPLPPKTEAELRASCAYILQNFKPSSLVYEEQYGTASSGLVPQLDYATIKQTAVQEKEADAPPLMKMNTHVSPFPKPEEPDEDIEVIHPSRYGYKSNTAIADLFLGEDKVQSRAQMILLGQPGTAASSAVTGISTRTRATSHGRSQSHPEQPSNPNILDGNALERPRTASRIDSIETTRSTPYTDTTEYPWTNSTAMTSVAMTPARSSKRTSGQVQSDTESSSVPKLDLAAALWMQQELEKAKKVQAEAKEKARVEVEAEKESGEADALAELHVQISPLELVVSQVQNSTKLAQVPARKPVPDSRSSSQQMVSSPDSRQQHQYLEQQDQQQQGFVQPSRISSRARSAARSIKNEIREYLRPSSRSHSRDVSRSASIDSCRSPASEFVPSSTPLAQRWKSYGSFQNVPFHNRDQSRSSQDVSRSSSSRGRTETRESPRQEAKPIINLNRELPPLPSLNQWKPVEPEKPKHVATCARTTNAQTPTTGKKALAPAARPDEKVEILAAQMGSPTPARVARSSLPAGYKKGVRSKTLSSAPSRYITTKAQSEFGSTSNDANVHIVQPVLSKSMGQERRRIQSFQIPPERRAGHLGHTGVAQQGTDRSSSSQRSRSISDEIKISRKIGMDDYGRLYDPRYHKVVEIGAVQTPPPPVPPKDAKMKKRWWNSSKKDRQQTWMDSVERVGAKSGMLRTDSVARAPVVRY